MLRYRCFCTQNVAFRAFYEPTVIFMHWTVIFTNRSVVLLHIYYRFSSYFSLCGGSGDIFFFTIFCIIIMNRTVIFTNQTIIFTNQIVIFANQTVIFTNRKQKFLNFFCPHRKNYGLVRINHGSLRKNYAKKL